METIATLGDLRPGDIGLGPIGGLVGLGVGLGQLALGEGWELSSVPRIKIRHACIVTRAAAGDDPPMIVEAMPSGARFRSALPDTMWTPEWSWVRLPEDYPGQAEDAASIARLMGRLEIPYSFPSYLYLAQWRLGLSTDASLAWINRRHNVWRAPLPSGRNPTAGIPVEAICSVLVDQSWTLTGKKIMHGVPYQCVTPKQLANTLRYKIDGATWAFPGR